MGRIKAFPSKRMVDLNPTNGALGRPVSILYRCVRDRRTSNASSFIEHPWISFDFGPADDLLMISEQIGQ